MKLLFASVLVSFLAASTGWGQSNEEAAETAVLDWLSYIDSGQYVTSWNNAAAVFKDQIDAQQWESAAINARSPLGELRGRTTITAEYTTSLPGAPDGEYVVLQFDAEFANKANGVETVTAVLENGTWRVAGYFIR